MSPIARFMIWAKTAPVEQRAEATRALVDAWRGGKITASERLLAVTAMIALLDDPSAEVRHALAEAVAHLEEAPRTVILGLAQEAGAAAELVLARSPLLSDAELVDAVAVGNPRLQAAAAVRERVSPALAAAIGEVGGRLACLCLLRNRGAKLTRATFERVAERFGEHADIREALVAREDLPVGLRHALVKSFTAALKAAFAGRGELALERAERAAFEACEKATLAIAAGSAAPRTAALVHHLRSSGDLTASLLLRAALSGQVGFVGEAFAQLAGVPASRVAHIVCAPESFGFAALYKRAGLPAPAFGAFVAALEMRFEAGADPERPWRLSPAAVAHVAAVCTREAYGGLDGLVMLLRRFELEVAREAAREYEAVEAPAVIAA
jgi:uncharacterized protein (DUF2336 family)